MSGILDHVTSRLIDLVDVESMDKLDQEEFRRIFKAFAEQTKVRGQSHSNNRTEYFGIIQYIMIISYENNDIIIISGALCKKPRARRDQDKSFQKSL